MENDSDAPAGPYRDCDSPPRLITTVTGAEPAAADPLNTAPLPVDEHANAVTCGATRVDELPCGGRGGADAADGEVTGLVAGVVGDGGAGADGVLSVVGVGLVRPGPVGTRVTAGSEAVTDGVEVVGVSIDALVADTFGGACCTRAPERTPADHDEAPMTRTAPAPATATMRLPARRR